VRELLVFGPFNVVLGTLVVVVVVSNRLVSELLLEVKLNLHLLASGFSPPVVVLEEHVVQVQRLNEVGVYLVEMRWNVALLLDNTRTHLSNVHINHQAVVAVNLEEFVFSQILGVHEVLDVHMFVRKNHVGVSELVTRSFKVVDSQVLVPLVLVDAEEEIALGCNLLESVTLESLLLFGRELILETGQLKLVLDELVNSSLNCCNLTVVSWLGDCKV
jgi:hypothetical protein